MLYGCHVSIKNGYLEAAKFAYQLGARSFQYFPKNPRALSVKEFDNRDAQLCMKFCQEKGIKSIAHSPYPTDLTPSSNKINQLKESLINDLTIADQCGSIGVVVHFGSQIDKSEPLETYKRMIEVLNLILMDWEGDCLLLIENNAGKSGLFGVTIEELVQIRQLTDFPEKIGFCLDTCHLFASGVWDGTNWDEFEHNSEKLNFFTELKAIHLNNSAYPSGSMKDRHAGIKDGYIKENQFIELLRSPYLKNKPAVLETPRTSDTIYKEEIDYLSSLLF